MLIRLILISLLLCASSCRGFTPFYQDQNFKPEEPIIYGRILIDGFGYTNKLEHCAISVSTRSYGSRAFSLQPLNSFLKLTEPSLEEGGIFIINYNAEKGDSLKFHHITCLTNKAKHHSGFMTTHSFPKTDITINNIGKGKAIYLGDIRVSSVWKKSILINSGYGTGIRHLTYKINNIYISDNNASTKEDVSKILKDRYPTLELNLNNSQSNLAIYKK